MFEKTKILTFCATVQNIKIYFCVKGEKHFVFALYGHCIFLLIFFKQIISFEDSNQWKTIHNTFS